MSDETGTIDDEVSQEIEIDGFKLEIYAQKLGEKEWALCVANELGVVSHWTEFFRTANDAMAAARKAIETEGVGAFLNSEGFDYLLH